MAERDLDDTSYYNYEDEGDEENLVEICYGEYGSQSKCSTCPNRTECKKFTETEKAIVQRYQGKYTGTGKFVGKDRY